MAKFNSFKKTTKLPKCITELILLSSARIEHLQGVSALSATSSISRSFSVQFQNDKDLEVAMYIQVPIFENQCERAEKVNESALAANTGDTGGGPGGGGVGKTKIITVKDSKIMETFLINQH